MMIDSGYNWSQNEEEFSVKKKGCVYGIMDKSQWLDR